MTRKTAFFEGWFWFKFNNLGLALGTNLKFYTSLSKGLKLKVRKFWGLIPTFAEVTEEKLVGGFFGLPPILNRVKNLAKHLGWSLDTWTSFKDVCVYDNYLYFVLTLYFVSCMVQPKYWCSPVNPPRRVTIDKCHQ